MGKGGLNCCIPGCTNYYEKTKGKKISYVGFPKKNCGKDDWRRRLIIAVRRADDNFNVDTAKICTTHFEHTSLLFHGKSYTIFACKFDLICQYKYLVFSMYMGSICINSVDFQPPSLQTNRVKTTWQCARFIRSRSSVLFPAPLSQVFDCQQCQERF